MGAFRLVKLVDPLNPTIITGGLVPRGAYNAATSYAVGDSVSYNGTSYVMYVVAAAGTLPTDTTKWQIVASIGTTGAAGAAGATGATGQGVPVGGTVNQVLAKIDSTNYNTTWVNQSGGGSSSLSVVTKTANYTITGSDDVVLADTTSGNITITLPTAVGVVKPYRVKKIATASTLTINTTSSQTIDGATTATITVKDASITVVSDNANWRII